tara:strand:- start:2 stop:709 length:708 start_codon:yes stop_codon:yes gene_type:complete
MIKKTIGISSSAVLVIGSIYCLFLLYPTPLFANKHQYRNFTIHSDTPIPQSIEAVVDDTIQRLEASELYEPSDNFKLYLCNKDWLFKFFTRNGNAGGVVNFIISPNIFIRESEIASNQLIQPTSWKNSMEDRPLSYFIAHEAVHSLQRKHDKFLIFKAPVAVTEGYAEYIAKAKSLSLEKLIESYRNSSPAMNPENGLYDRYNLYISFLIERKDYSFSRLVEEKIDLEEVLTGVY